jgi:hypothetical protein
MSPSINIDLHVLTFQTNSWTSRYCKSHEVLFSQIIRTTRFLLGFLISIHLIPLSLISSICLLYFSRHKTTSVLNLYRIDVFTLTPFVTISKYHLSWVI